jgi:hypothetical protein
MQSLTLLLRAIVIALFSVQTSFVHALSTARPIPRIGSPSSYVLSSSPSSIFVFAGNFHNAITRQSNVRAERIFLSSLLDQLGSEGIMIDMEGSPGAELVMLDQQFSAYRITLVTLPSLTSQSGVTITLTIWRNEEMGRSGLTRLAANSNSLSFQLYEGLLTVDIRGGAHNQKTQTAAAFAMKTFSTRDLWRSDLLQQDIEAWDVANTSRENRGLKIAEFIENFSDSPLIDHALRIYKAWPRYGGAVITSRTPACIEQINQLYFPYRHEQIAIDLLPKAFLDSDTFEIPFLRTTPAEKPLVNKRAWTLSQYGRTGQLKSCFVRQVGSDRYIDLSGCECAAFTQPVAK